MLAPKIHMGKTLYLSPETARIVDPIVRAELERMGNEDEDWGRVLGHLADAGPSSPEDLQVELGLRRQDLKKLRSPLERCGVLVARFERTGNDYQSVLYRWDQLSPHAVEGPPDLAPLGVAAVKAAVVVPEREPPRWFSWRRRWPDGLLDRLVAEGSLTRPGPGLLAAR